MAGHIAQAQLGARTAPVVQEQRAVQDKALLPVAGMRRDQAECNRVAAHIQAAGQAAGRQAAGHKPEDQPGVAPGLVLAVVAEVVR